MTIRDDKRSMRNELKLTLAKLGADAISARSAIACGHLIDRWPMPDPVMAYLAMPAEADAGGAMAAWRARGVTVCVPRTEWSSTSMTPAVLGGPIVEGRHGIREVEPNQPTLEPGDLRLVVVPGLGFTARGERLGRGAGFYDRFLDRLSGGTTTVGFALAAQMRDDLPTEPTDRAVDWVVTDDGVIDARPEAAGTEGV